MVNPNADQVEGDRCYHDLKSIPGAVQAVVIPGAGSVSDAPQCGRQHGITVIDGGCPFMFGPTTGVGDKIVRFVYGGHVSKQV